MAGSSKYWEKRALEREARWTDKCQKEIEQEMARYYAASIREIEKDILVLYGRFAMDNGLSMRDARTLLHGQEFRDWRMGMKEYLAEIKRLQDAGQISESRGLLRELNTLAMRSRITVLDKLRSETLRELDSLGRKTETAMGRFLGDAYKDAYYRSVFDIGKEGMFRGSFSKVDSKQVENVLRTPWSGKNYSERIWKDMQKLESTIQDVVTQGIHRGLSAQKMTQKVMERMNVSQSNAERLVRTEMNYAQNQAALEGIKDAGLMYYCFVAVMDRRTTPICREHDGEVFPVEEARAGSNVPPLHPRCRSTIIASLDEEGTGAKGGRRVSRGSKGQNISIPAEMKYSDWKAVYVDKSKTWAEWKQETGYKGREMFASAASSSSQAGVDSGIIKTRRDSPVEAEFRLERSMERKKANTGEFADLEIPLQKHAVEQVCRKYGVDISGLLIKIQRGEDCLRSNIAGATDYDRIGRIDLLPVAFKDEEQLIRTVLHEKVHVKQLRKYGKAYVQENLMQMERIAERCEELFWMLKKRRKCS